MFNAGDDDPVLEVKPLFGDIMVSAFVDPDSTEIGVATPWKVLLLSTFSFFAFLLPELNISRRTGREVF
jgi:hypothetical protein